MADKRKYRDRAEYLKAAVDKRRRKMREMAVGYKGGKCFLCGYHKCIMVCANCHREIHSGKTQLPAVMPVEKQGELREA